jgi:hypothetical protein
MKKIECTNNSNVEGNLKLNIQYEACEEDNTFYGIVMGNGVKAHYRKERFKEV